MYRCINIILGAPNTKTGELSSIAKQRLDLCFSHYKACNLVLCTGGWGKHFNASKHPHAYYSKAYLKNKGIPENCFLPSALSSNTVEDAAKIKIILHDIPKMELAIYTSDFHLNRVKLIFNTILKSYNMKFYGAKNTYTPTELEAVVLHEKKAIASILKNGLYW